MIRLEGFDLERTDRHGSADRSELEDPREHVARRTAEEEPDSFVDRPRCVQRQRRLSCVLVERERVHQGQDVGDVVGVNVRQDDRVEVVQ